MRQKSTIKLIALIAGLLVITLSSQAQLSWYVQMIVPGTYQVDVSPTELLEEVSFSVDLIMESSSYITVDHNPFTDYEYPVLQPGITYSKYYYCDTKYVEATGKQITFYVTVPGGKSDGLETYRTRKQLMASKNTISTGKKKYLNFNDKLSPSVNIIDAKAFISAGCPNINPWYKDLDEWLQAMSTNKIQVQVSIINQPAADGNHYYTAWGKSYLKKGTGSDGNCLLTSEPPVNVLYSDRSRTMPENKNSYGGQPFSLGQHDILEVKLDMARDVIIARSVTWNFEERFTNVIRNGSIIYGVKKGKMIVLNLLKQN